MVTRHWKLDDNVPSHSLIPNLFSEEECHAAIARFEAIGFTPAKLHRANSDLVEPEFRNNYSATTNDAMYAGELYARIKHHLPSAILGHRPAHMHDYLRCYRYDVGQYFAPHRDGSIFTPPGQTMVTCLIYLNQDYAGGETIFVGDGGRRPDVRVEPKLGAVLLFQHPLLHQGAAVVSGRKYVLGAKIAYTPIVATRA